MPWPSSIVLLTWFLEGTNPAFSFSNTLWLPEHTKRLLCYGGKQPGLGVNYLLLVLALLLTKRLWIDQFTSPNLSCFFYKLGINNAFLERNVMKIKFID